MEEVIESAEEVTIEQLVSNLFNLPPKEPNSCQLLSFESDPPYIFEMLITCLMESISIKYGSLTDIDLEDITEQHLEALNPWFHSFGFSLHAFVIQNEQKHIHNNYYCKILIKDQTDYNFLFNEKGITKDYHFILNGSFSNEENELKNIYCILQRKNTIIKINFDFFLFQKALTGLL